jgi:CRISPR-associated endonuclease/helicase Cas3
LRVLEGTWRLLEEDSNKKWRIPEDNRYLVEKGTHPDYLKQIVDEQGDKWEAHQRYLFGEELADKQLPDLVGIDRSKPFGEEGFAEDLEQIKTRLGTDNYTVELPESMEGPFGNIIEEVSISETRFEEKPEEMTASSVKSTLDGFRFVFGEQEFEYDRFGISTCQWES